MTEGLLQGWGLTPVPRTASATVLPPTRKSSGTPITEGLRGAASALAAWRARRGVALDITALPGMAVLTAKVITHQMMRALLLHSTAARLKT